MESKIETIKKMLVNDVEDDFLNHVLGLEYLKSNQLQVAKNCFVKILTKNPDYLGSYYHLANTQLLLNQKIEAINTLQSGLLIAKKQNKTRTYNELYAKLEELDED